jgi:diguanylate cyclase (GGDEF)-like protein/PAS domain S-box-containing protein
VRNSSEVVSIVDPDGTVRYANSAWEWVLGYDPQEAVGMNVLEHVHPEDLPHVLEETGKALAEEGVARNKAEYRFRHKDGSWRWLESVGTYLIDDPAVGGVMVSSRDVTDRKEAEERLQESEKLHRQRARELDLLHRVRTALARELDPGAVCRAVVEEVAAAYGYVLVSAYLLEAEVEHGGDLVLQHQVGYASVIERIPVGHGVSGRAVREGRSVLVEDVREDPAFLGAIEGITSEICVPLFDDGEAVGFLNVESTGGNRLTGDDLKLLKAMGEHAGTALGRAGLHARALEAEERYRALVENIPAVVYIDAADETNSVIYRSPYAREVLGYEPEEFLLDPEFWQNLLHPDDRERVLAENERTNRTGEPFRLEYRMTRKDGRAVWLRDEAFLIRDGEGRPKFWQGYFVDVTERKEAEEALRRSEASLSESQRIAHLGTWEWNVSTGEVWWSEETYLIHGLVPGDGIIFREKVEEAFFPEDLPLYRKRIDEALSGTAEGYDFRHRIRRSDGEVRWVHGQAEVVHGEGGEPLRMIGTVHDITERKALEDRLSHQAVHDALTDLPNRQLLLNRLGHALARTERRRGAEVAVLFIDLDGFKVVNDSLGHEIGDRLLVAVAERLKGCLRPEDTLARFGGDEFIVLLEEVEGADDALRVTRRITEEFRGPFVLDGRELFVGLSIGVALGEAHTKSPEELLRDADTAMYRAKDEAADYRVFDPKMHEQALDRLEVESYLRHALEKEEFTVYYQPKFRLGRTDRIEGVEALVRWEHPQRGFMLPEEFIPIAEETGLIIPLGEWVMKEACRQAKEWRERYPSEPPLLMCVNISAAQVRHPGLLKDVRSALRESGLAADELVLEITEGTLLKDTEVIEAVFRELKRLGVRLAIDDFGKEYSSLSYLNRLPVDVLKIDRLFLESLKENPSNTIIVEAVIALAHSLGLEVIGEGVEGAEQLELLRMMRCDFAQGYHLARPLPSEEVERLLADRETF